MTSSSHVAHYSVFREQATNYYQASLIVIRNYPINYVLGTIHLVSFTFVHLPLSVTICVLMILNNYAISDLIVKASPASKRAVLETIEALKKQGHECIEFEPTLGTYLRVCILVAYNGVCIIRSIQYVLQSSDRYTDIYIIPSFFFSFRNNK